MQIELVEFIHPRIAKTCVKLLEDGHFQYAALEAMKQVEIALKEKGLAPEKSFGVNLCKRVLNKGQHIMLSVPLGKDLQEQACELFCGAFGYYRNYAAHKGEKIDKKICIRALMLASELLDLIGASNRSYEGIGGILGLIKEGIFKDQQELKLLLESLDGQWIVGGDVGSLGERFPFNDIQWEAIFELDLVEYSETIEEGDYPGEQEEIGWFNLTYLGKKVLSELG
jgi:uncharacterized protein (TIGR02391 family)